MNTLTPEQIEQNAAAYVAAKTGKPFQCLCDGKWVQPLALGDRDILWYLETWLCRPVPEPEPPKPWDMQTCPPLPFEVRQKSNGNRLCVTSAKPQMCDIGTGWASWESLLMNYVQRDGSPCGVTP